MSLFQKSIAAAALTMAFVPAALGQATLNADGFKENPVCNKPEIVKENLAEQKKFPSGIIAESPRFKLEIYPKTKSDGQISKTAWTLVGDNRKGSLCYLEASITTNVKDTDWHARYYDPAQLALK